MTMAEPDEPRAARPETAADQWFPEIYDCLRELAERWFRGAPPGHTLEPTVLVHDAYLRLAGTRAVEWNDRQHFFAVAARAIRQILVDHARRKSAVKRGRGWSRMTLSGVASDASEPAIDLLSLDDALAELTSAHPRQARVVELRYFAGFSIEESAEALDISVGTVKLDWRFAKAWLTRRLG